MLITGCHTSKPASTGSIKESTISLNGNWELQKLWGSDNKWTKNPVLVMDYDNKTFTGNNGCNNITGKFKLAGNFIAFDKQIISTKMACPGYNESAFNNALLKVNKFSITGEELELSQDYIVLLSFKKQ